MKIVSVLNFKGGVGKTTFTACIAQALALTGFRVLVIDNDHQHNLTTMLHLSVSNPNIRDVYRSSVGKGGDLLNEAIRVTKIPRLFIITAPPELINSDVKDPYILQKCLNYTIRSSQLDYVLIDNGPGMDLLQETSLHASTNIFVPTALSNFALPGIRELKSMLANRFPYDSPISKIIPLFYKNSKAKNNHLQALKESFPSEVTNTCIPNDTIYDSLVESNKILFVNHLYSPAAAYYLKLMFELFDLDEEKTWQTMVANRKKSFASAAKTNFANARKKRKETPQQPLFKSARKQLSDQTAPLTLYSQRKSGHIQHERRHYYRYKVDYPMKYKYPKDMDVKQCKLLDISEGGLCFSTSSNIMDNSNLEVIIQYNDHTFTSVATVRWMKDYGKRHHVGVQFVGPHSQNRIKMVEYFSTVEI